MSIRRPLTAVFVLVALPHTAHADTLQQQVLAGARTITAADFSFTQANRFERTGVPATQIVQRYDPRRGASAWTLVKIDDRAPTAKQVADAAKRSAKAQVPTYARIAEWFGAPATRVATTPTSVTYRFATLPKGTIKMGSHDASANTSVEAVVNTAGRIPFVERARFTSNAPFRMFMVAKVERFVITATHRLLGDGRPVLDATATEFGGSLMGKAQTLKTRTSYTDYAAVR